MIALDVDGVVLNLEQRIIELGEDLFARPMLRLNNRYRFADRYGLNELEIEQLWREFDQRGLLGQLKPYAGAIEAIQEMQSLGMPIAFVTGIGSNWQAARDANLRACGLRDFQLFCTGSAFEPKRPVLEAIGAHTGHDPAGILIGNGSNELTHTLGLALIEPGRPFFAPGRPPARGDARRCRWSAAHRRQARRSGAGPLVKRDGIAADYVERSGRGGRTHIGRRARRSSGVVVGWRTRTDIAV